MDKIEGFILEKDGELSWLNLTLTYDIEFNYENKHINIIQHKPVYTLDNIASFTALFGINASGKTELLLQLARSCSGNNGRFFGILYSRDGKPHLHKGRVLNQWTCDISISPLKNPVHTICYSSSPFDAVRWNNISNVSHIHNVSPRFEKNIPFSIPLMMQTLAEIKGKMDLFKNIEFSLGSAVPSENICIRNILDIISPSLDTRLKKARPANNKLITGWIKNWRTQVTTEERLQNRINITSLVTDASRSPKRSSFIMELTQLLQVANENDYSAFINLVTHHASNERISLTLNEIEDTLKGIISLRDSKRERIDAETLNDYISQTTDREKRLLQKLFELGILRYEFSKISSGESALLNIFLAIGNALVNVVPDDSSPILLLIDEGETFLHPSWQKKYLSQLLDYIGKNEKTATRVHLIITTHSLIIAGDCPPRTLYDMEKQKNVNGFGLGPKSILEDVYNAGDFSGELSIKLFEKIISNVKIKDRKTFKSAFLLIESLADEKLKNVLKEKIKNAGDFHD